MANQIHLHARAEETTSMLEALDATREHKARAREWHDAAHNPHQGRGCGGVGMFENWRVKTRSDESTFVAHVAHKRSELGRNEAFRFRRTRHSLLQEKRSPGPCRTFSCCR